MGPITHTEGFSLKSPASFFVVILSVFSRPYRFFSRLAKNGGLLNPIAFIVIIQLLPLLAGHLLSGPGPWGRTGLRWLATSAENVIIAYAVYLSAFRAFKVQISLYSVTSVVAYAGSTFILLVALPFIPAKAAGFVYMAALIASFCLILVGLRATGDMLVWQSAGCMIIAVIVLLLVELFLRIALRWLGLPDLPL